MKRSNTQNIKEVVDQLLDQLQIKQKLKEIEAINTWKDMMGKTVARHLKDVTIHRRVMFVRLTSSIVRAELNMMRSAMVKAVNDRVGETVIDDIVIK
jgi:predicted nucleic acid-binding Zn ribbon protein